MGVCTSKQNKPYINQQKKIDGNYIEYNRKEIEHLMFGFCKLSIKKRIPNEIINLCSLFYYIYFAPNEYFDRVGKHMKIEKKTLITNECEQLGEWKTGYGVKIIYPMRKIIYLWTFVIRHRSMYGSIYIGLDDNKSLWMDKSFAYCQNVNYSYHCNGALYSCGECIRYDDEYFENDIIIMKLDFKSSDLGILSYCLIHDDLESLLFKIAFNDISRDITYKMAVALDSKSSVELLEYAEEY
eukprot:447288_1